MYECGWAIFYGDVVFFSLIFFFSHAIITAERIPEMRLTIASNDSSIIGSWIISVAVVSGKIWVVVKQQTEPTRKFLMLSMRLIFWLTHVLYDDFLVFSIGLNTLQLDSIECNTIDKYRVEHFWKLVEK